MWWGVNTEPSSEPGAGAAEEMRAALRSRIGERLKAEVRRSTPQALMAALAASAYAPLLIGGNTDSALVLTGAAGASVGANAISEILQQGIDRLRGRELTLREMEDWLAERFEDLLARQDRQAMVLQGQLAVIFSQIGASEAALEAAMETGGQALRAEIEAGLAQLDARFGAVGAALGVMDLKLDEIRRDVGVLRHAAGRQHVLEPARATSPWACRSHRSPIRSCSRFTMPSARPPMPPAFRHCRRTCRASTTSTWRRS